MPFWVRNYEERREKRITTVGTHVFYMKAGSQFLEHGPPVQHPKRERWPSKSLPPQPPPLILKPKPPGYEILLGCWKKEQLRGLKTLSSFYLACGRRILPWFSPKEEEADQAESAAKSSLGRESSSSSRPENSPNKAYHADPAGRSERREKIHPNSSPLPEARNRWSRAQREKEDGFSMG